MNIFALLFWVVWFFYVGVLIFLLKEVRFRHRERNSCAWCKHYKGCKELHRIIDDGIPMPCACQDFQRREDGKHWPGPGGGRAKRQKCNTSGNH